MTALHKYLELSLGAAGITSLAAHVSAKRQAGKTWQQVADDLHAETGSAVSRETVRQWFNEQTAAAR